MIRVSVPTKLPPRNSTVEVPPQLDDPHTPYRDRIIMLLHANDGSLWQRDIVESLDTSKATVSRRLMDLESSEEIDRLEFRGEKIVTLPECTIQLLP